MQNRAIKTIFTGWGICIPDQLINAITAHPTTTAMAIHRRRLSRLPEETRARARRFIWNRIGNDQLGG